MKGTVITALLLLIWVNHISAQSAKATISIIGEVKESYSVGDTLHALIKVNISPEICNDGMEKTKTFLSGLDMINSENWNQKNDSNWEKKMLLIFRDNKKRISKITVFRKADKGDFFVQKKISIKE